MTPTRRKRRPRTLWFPLGVVVLVSVGLFAGVFAAGWSPKLGLDLAGGAYVVYAPSHKTATDKLQEAANIISERIGSSGISNAQVNVQGQQIVVELAGVKNPQSLVQQIGQTGQVEFRPVACASQSSSGTSQAVILPPYTKPKSKSSSSSSLKASTLVSICQKQHSSTSNSQSNSLNVIAAEFPSTQETVGGTPEQYVLYPEPQLTNYKRPYYRVLLGPLAANGTIIANANAGVISGQWVVQFTMTSKGSAKWDSIAQANFHKQVAIAISGEIASAPVIQPQQASFTSFNGSGEISGSSTAPLTQTQAEKVALVMRYGALPVQLHQLTVETVSPSLGKSSLRAGLLAGLLGMALVMAYTIVYYRALGIVVVTGLGLTALLLWGITSILSHTAGETLDLAGVTGVIVSIGVTVDSYIVYFERLKDDVRQGKTIRSSVDKGFQRAYRTVLAADAVSLIGAVILYVLAIGPVRGFAFFLGLSTLLDVATAYLFTRPLVILMGRNRIFTEARWIGVASGLAPEPIAVGEPA